MSNGKIQKIIYYAEIKSNLNLDTEKSKSTIKKCIEIKDELKRKYEEYEIKMCLVGIRYYTKNIIPNTIIKKYNDIYENVCGINEYLQTLNIQKQFHDENEYILLLNYICEKMF